MAQDTAHTPQHTERAHNNSAAGHTQCSVVQSTKQCGTTQKALVVQRGTQGAVGK